MLKLDNNIVNFFINEYFEDKKYERTLTKLDIAECIFTAYTAGQPTEKGHTNKPFEYYKEWRKGLYKEIGIEDKKEKEVFWGELKKRARAKKKKRIAL